MRLRVGAVRAWRAAAYLATMLATAVATVLALPLLCHPALRGPWGRWHLARAGVLQGVPVVPYRPSARRYLRWVPVHVVTAVPLGLAAVVCLGNLLLAVVVIPLWWAFPASDPPRLLVELPVAGWGTALTLGLTQLLALGAFAYWAFPPLAGAHARISLAMLAPSASEQLAVRVAELTRTRSEVLEAHGAELRRIERDLHDGTQARLVAIATRLAVARDTLAESPPIVAKALKEAHELTEQAMVELREVLHGIYPPILADRGLPGALRTVAARSSVPTRVEVSDVGQVPAAVGAVAYFAVAEALTNVAKHSRATQAEVRVHRNGDRLVVTVGDNGVGGAGETPGGSGKGGVAGGSDRGTGLAGIRRRAQALDGTVALSSPAGGPTEVTVELPCG